MVDFLMARLGPNVDDATFLARIRVMQSLVEEHVEEEESEVFTHIESLDEAVVRRLDQEMQDDLEEVERVDELLGRAAQIGRRIQRLAASFLDTGLEMPRRVVRTLVPSRWLRSDQRYVLAARIASSVPRVVVNSLYYTVSGRSSQQGRRAA